MCDVQLAGKGIFQHTGASLVMAQLNDSSFIAEHIWTIPVSRFVHNLYLVTYIYARYMHKSACLHARNYNVTMCMYTYVCT